MKVRGFDNLERDEISGAVLNTDVNAYEAHIARRKDNINKNYRINKLESEIKELKNLVYNILEKLEEKNG
jgi:hypothetical protein|tara:strand:+ start:367 stop:576 length:210 start_codon:yes stop_codon:yes gene_type:complete